VGFGARTGAEARRVPRRDAARRGRADLTRVTDGELVTLALNGAHAAFSQLLHRHAPHLRRVLARRLRNPDDVLDLIQDTQFAVWKALQSYDARRPFEAWLTAIALNKWRDWARHEAVRCSAICLLQAGAEGGGAVTEEPSAERLAMDGESLRDLGRALEGLPRPLRDPLILTAVHELPQGAAARALKLTRKAVEMRVRRARQHLQQALRPQGC